MNSYTFQLTGALVRETNKICKYIRMKALLNFLGLLIFSALFASCNPSGKANSFDYGHIENDKYLNSFFGLELTIPDGWVVQSKEKTEEISDLGKDLIAGDDENLKAALDASEINTANLLAVFKHELGAVVDYNPGFILVAENLNNAPGIKIGSDYLFQSRKLLENSQMEFEHIDEEFSREVVSNRDFDTMNCTINYMGFMIHQKYYSTIQNGFSISVIISFSDEDQKQELEQIVNSLVFSK